MIWLFCCYLFFKGSDAATTPGSSSRRRRRRGRPGQGIVEANRKVRANGDYRQYHVRNHVVRREQAFRRRRYLLAGVSEQRKITRPTGMTSPECCVGLHPIVFLNPGTHVPNTTSLNVDIPLLLSMTARYDKTGRRKGGGEIHPTRERGVLSSVTASHLHSAGYSDG